MIAIYLGPGWEMFSPLDIETKGLGGSETAAVRLAEKLTELGHSVTVYAEVEEFQHCNVAYRPYAAFDPGESRLAVISSRRPALFGHQINARVRMLWMHDTDCGADLTEDLAGGIDHVLVLSRWHRDRMRRLYPFLDDKLCQIRNGIELSYFEGEAPQRPRRVLYTSAPERGLDILLELWPQIRKRVPDAELGYCCAGVYDRIAAERPESASHLARCVALAEASEGTHDFGALSQPDLARLMRGSMVWAHPSWSTPDGVPFQETSCIGAMEAQAAGCLVVAAASGALPETVRVGRLIGGEPLSPRWRERFVEEICAGLTDDRIQQWVQGQAPQAAARLGWGEVARQVVSLLDAWPSADEQEPTRLDPLIGERLQGGYNIEQRGLGSRSSDREKSMRETDLLAAELERDPYDPHAAFYLGQSLMDAGEMRAALAVYEQRAATGGVDEEAFQSEMLAGQICETLEEPWERARDFYLDAYRRRPHRAEPLLAIARNRRLANEFEEAYRYARRAAALPYPAGERLPVGRELPADERARIEANRDFAVPALGSLAEALVGTLELGTDAAWPVAEARVIGGTRARIAIQALVSNPEDSSERLLLDFDLDSQLSVANVEPGFGDPAAAMMEVDVDRGTLRVEQSGPHRLVLCDESGTEIEVSTPFWLTGPGETCGGIAQIGERLVLVFDTPGGVQLAALDLDQALAMLEPLDAA